MSKKIAAKLPKHTALSFRTKLLFGIGFVLILIPTFFYINETIQLTFFTPKVSVVTNTYPIPSEIIIPDITMQLPIVEEAINNGRWNIADNGASHLTTSARPGEVGPIILYGHNTTSRFGPIRWLSVGQRIIITTADKKKHTYIITKTKEVFPDQISELLHTNGETLILYTCDGFADLQRFLVFATPSKNM